MVLSNCENGSFNGIPQWQQVDAEVTSFFLTESIECQNNFLVVIELLKLGSWDKAVKMTWVISGGGKGACSKTTENTIENLFIHFSGFISGTSWVPTPLNTLFRNSQREQFFHQRMKFHQISDICRDILISVRA